MGTAQVIPARFMLKRNVDLSFDDNLYLVINKEEEGDDEMIRLAIRVGMMVTGSLTRQGETSLTMARI